MGKLFDKFYNLMRDKSCMCCGKTTSNIHYCDECSEKLRKAHQKQQDLTDAPLKILAELKEIKQIALEIKDQLEKRI